MSKATQKSYTPHIKDFLKVMGERKEYEQSDLNRYFSVKGKQDDKKKGEDKASHATKKARRAAIRFLIEEVLTCKVKWKIYKTKSVR